MGTIYSVTYLFNNYQVPLLEFKNSCYTFPKVNEATGWCGGAEGREWRKLKWKHMYVHK